MSCTAFAGQREFIGGNIVGRPAGRHQIGAGHHQRPRAGIVGGRCNGRCLYIADGNAIARQVGAPGGGRIPVGSRRNIESRAANRRGTVLVQQTFHIDLVSGIQRHGKGRRRSDLNIRRGQGIGCASLSGKRQLADIDIVVCTCRGKQARAGKHEGVGAGVVSGGGNRRGLRGRGKNNVIRHEGNGTATKGSYLD